MSVMTPRPVAGSTMLPVGFAHPHASEEASAIAENGMILRVPAEQRMSREGIRTQFGV